MLSAYSWSVGHAAYLPAQDSSAVACIADVQPARMQQEDDGCGALPGPFPCRAAQSALALRPCIILHGSDTWDRRLQQDADSPFHEFLQDTPRKERH